MTRARSGAITIGSAKGAEHQLAGLKASGRQQVVLAGHGSFNTVTDKKYPKVRLPPSVTMVFWCHHGEGLLDVIGQFVESKKPLSQLPDHLQTLAKSTGKKTTGIPEVVTGGSEVWNYRLTYPSRLTLGSQPGSVKSSMYNRPITPASPHGTLTSAIKDDQYCIVPPLSGGIKDRGVPIIAMLAGYWSVCNGAIVHWCACRSISDR